MHLDGVRRPITDRCDGMSKTELITMARFNGWANRRILVKAAHLPESVLRRRARLSYPSPMATLVHILDAQWYWREGAEFGQLPREKLEPSDFAGIKELRSRWEEEDRLLIEYLQSRTEGQAAGTVTYTWPQARPRTRPLWQVIMHVVNHGTQHRSELAIFLTLKDLSPGNVDFLDFIKHDQRTRN